MGRFGSLVSSRQQNQEKQINDGVKQSQETERNLHGKYREEQKYHGNVTQEIKEGQGQ